MRPSGYASRIRIQTSQPHEGQRCAALGCESGRVFGTGLPCPIGRIEEGGAAASTPQFSRKAATSSTTTSDHPGLRVSPLL